MRCVITCCCSQLAVTCGGDAWRREILKDRAPFERHATCHLKSHCRLQTGCSRVGTVTRLSAPIRQRITFSRPFSIRPLCRIPSSSTRARTPIPGTHVSFWSISWSADCFTARSPQGHRSRCPPVSESVSSSRRCPFLSPHVLSSHQLTAPSPPRHLPSTRPPDYALIRLHLARYFPTSLSYRSHRCHICTRQLPIAVAAAAEQNAALVVM